MAIRGIIVNVWGIVGEPAEYGPSVSTIPIVICALLSGAIGVNGALADGRNQVFRMLRRRLTELVEAPRRATQ